MFLSKHLRCALAITAFVVVLSNAPLAVAQPRSTLNKKADDVVKKDDDNRDEKEKEEGKKATISTVPLVIDLADKQNLPDLERTIRLAAGNYTITVINAVPGREYWMNAGVTEKEVMPALDAAEAKFIAKLPSPPAEEKAATENPCRRATRLLAETSDESSVRDRADDLRKLVVQRTCQGADGELANEVLNGTKLTFTDTAVALEADSIRSVTIASRAGSSWKVMLSSVGRGLWQTTYGFAFNPNHDDEYFAEAAGENQFVVKRKPRDEGSITMLPAVFWTWLSSGQAFSNWQHGPTLGLGVTTGAPGGRLGVLGGYTLRFNQNIGITGGISVYQHRRLDGTYHEGQTLKENLDSDKLNKDSIRPNAFIAFTLRFGSNPWGNGEGEKKNEKKK